MGNSLLVQWLGLCAFTAKDPGSIPGQGTKIPQASQLENTHTHSNFKKQSSRELNGYTLQEKKITGQYPW